MAVLDTTLGGASITNALGITGYPFTMAMWVRRTGDHAGTSYMARLGGAGSHHAFLITAAEYAGYQARYNNATPEYNNYTGSTVAPNAWVPLVIRATSSSLRDFYKGALANTSQDTDDIGGFDTAVHPIEVFDLGFVGSARFLGLVSHVAVWNKALTNSEVEDFINGGNPLAIANEAGNDHLAAYWAEDFFQDTDWYYEDKSGNGYHLLLEAAAVRDTTTAPAVDPPPTTANLGITITGIKEPNETDELVTDVSNARARIWVGAVDETVPKYVLSDETITGGAMTLSVDSHETISDPLIVVVDWDAGSGETKYFRTTGNIIDLDA